MSAMPRPTFIGALVVLFVGDAPAGIPAEVHRTVLDAAAEAAKKVRLVIVRSVKETLPLRVSELAPRNILL